MAKHDRTRPTRLRDRFAPAVESMEARELLSVFGPYPSTNQQLAAREAVVRHEYDNFVSEVKGLELKSQATPAEFLALRDDARAISSAASLANLDPAVAGGKALAVSLQLDRSPLYGSLGDSGWDTVSSRVTTNLQALGTPQPLIDKTLADMKALAVSAGVASSDFETFTRDFNTLRDGESSLRNSS